MGGGGGGGGAAFSMDSKPFFICHMCSGWTCSHLWKELGASGRPANSGFQWQTPTELHGDGQWAQGPLEDVGPSGHPHEVGFRLFGQWQSHQLPAGGHFVGLWQCSSCSSLHKGTDTGPADEWMNEWHIYIALYCVLLYTQSALQSCGGVSPQPPLVCSIHLDDATAARVQRHQCTHHTSATDGEERES